MIRSETNTAAHVRYHFLLFYKHYNRLRWKHLLGSKLLTIQPPNYLFSMKIRDAVQLVGMLKLIVLFMIVLVYGDVMI